MSHDEFNPEQPVPPAMERPAGSGIMVFSSSAKMLYTNVAAHDFLKRLNQIERGRSTDGALPVALTHLIDKMKQVCECRPLDRNSGQLKATRLVVGQDQPVLLQAFGLSDRSGPHRSRILITMEEVATSVPTKL